MNKQLSFLTVFCFLFIVKIIYSATYPVVTTDKKNRKQLYLTVYNKNFALVRDIREFSSPYNNKRIILEIKDVSPSIKPETAVLISDKFKVITQKFVYNLLTPDSLLKYFEGKEVFLKKRNSKKYIKAKIISVNKGIILKIDNRIETGVLVKDIIFPYIPKDLNTLPLFKSLIKLNKKKEFCRFELLYLTSGISWKANYVGILNSNNKMNLKGFITVKNRCRMSFSNVFLNLIAGDVNYNNLEGRKINFLQKVAEPKTFVEQQKFFEYYKYTVPEPINLNNNESIEIPFIDSNINLEQRYVIEDKSYFLASKRKLNVKAVFNIKNPIPIPEGVIRIYLKNKKGDINFVGEDLINNTPTNENINISVGNVFNITAEKVKTFYKKDKHGYKVGYSIKIKNAKDKDINVEVFEFFSGDWKILRESHVHKKISWNKVQWNILVKPKSYSILSYLVEIKN